MITDVFLDKKRVKVCEHIVKIATYDRVDVKQEKGAVEGKLNGNCDYTDIITKLSIV